MPPSTHTTLPAATTTTTLPVPTTTSTTLPGATTTTSTSPVPTTTSTTLPAATSTTTVPVPSTTSTTAPPPCRSDPECDDGDPCTEDRCTITGCRQAPLEGSEGVTCAFDAAAIGTCRDEPSFGAVNRKLSQGKNLIERAGRTSKRKTVRQLVKKASKTLRGAAALAKKLESRGKLSLDCRDAVTGVVTVVVQGAGQL